MTDEDLRPNPDRTPVLVYTENLRVPVWWWIALVVAVVVVAVQAVLVDSEWWLWALLVMLPGLLAWFFWRLGQDSVRVEADGQGNGTLTAGRAVLPFDAISRTAVVPKTAKAAAMGRQLDPAAWVVHKGFVPAMVIIVLDDPSDPTPYWLVSTRHPEALVDALPDNFYS